MPKVKDRGKEALTTWVDTKTYYKFLFKCERNGQNISTRLAELVCADVEESDQVTIVAEVAAKNGQNLREASQNQVDFINSLYVRLGKDDFVTHGELNVKEADKLIRALKDELNMKAELGE